jgi:ATP-dependent Clp protease ATP-binding subunit ClpX
MIQLNTRNILFICGGAFEGLEKVISQRVGRRTMGFGAAIGEAVDDDALALMAQVQPEDLLSFGLIPEFVGRVPVIATLDSLTEDDLFRILTEPKNAIVQQCQRLFAMDGVEVRFAEEALRRIVALTVKKGTGARGLRSVMEQAMMDLMYEAPSQEGPRELVVTAEMVEKGVDSYDTGDEVQRKRA